MPIDDRHQQRWRAQRTRRQTVRDVAQLLHTFAPLQDEDEAAYRRRLTRQDDQHAMEMDTRESAANDDDGTA